MVIEPLVMVNMLVVLSWRRLGMELYMLVVSTVNPQHKCIRWLVMGRQRHILGPLAMGEYGALRQDAMGEGLYHKHMVSPRFIVYICRNHEW